MEITLTVNVLSFQQIGKEADNLEERKYIGESEDDAIVHSFAREDRVRLRKHILKAHRELNISDRMLCAEATVSPRTLYALRRNRKLEDRALFALVEAIERTRRDKSFTPRTRCRTACSAKVQTQKQAETLSRCGFCTRIKMNGVVTIEIQVGRTSSSVM